MTLAAKSNNLLLVDALLKAGAPVNEGGHCGGSELDYAEQHKNSFLIQRLKQAGSQKNNAQICE